VEWAREKGLEPSKLRWRLDHPHLAYDPFAPDNLRGTTTKVLVEYEGEQMTVKEAARRSGTKLSTIYWRLKHDKPLF
jgi:hypothetical protein